MKLFSLAFLFPILFFACSPGNSSKNILKEPGTDTSQVTMVDSEFHTVKPSVSEILLTQFIPHGNVKIFNFGFSVDSGSSKVCSYALRYDEPLACDEENGLEFGLMIPDSRSIRTDFGYTIPNSLFSLKAYHYSAWGGYGFKELLGAVKFKELTDTSASILLDLKGKRFTRDSLTSEVLCKGSVRFSIRPQEVKGGFNDPEDLRIK